MRLRIEFRVATLVHQALSGYAPSFPRDMEVEQLASVAAVMHVINIRCLYKTILQSVSHSIMNFLKHYRQCVDTKMSDEPNVKI